MRNVALLALWLGSQTTAVAAEYRIGVGDHLEVKVYDEPALTGEVAVDDSCRIGVGLLGAVEVCGRNTAELAEQLTLAFADGYLVSPVVAVKVTKFRSQKVDVFGEVNKKGPVYLEGQTTLLDVISMAGGPSADNVVQIEVTTPDGVANTYDMGTLASIDPVLVSPGSTVTLEPGEVVYVEGEVKRPGVVTLIEGLTVTQALALAGGPDDYANLRRVIIRRSNGGKVRVNVQRINRGLDDDPMLGSDDYLLVPSGAF